ncbi:MAG TPA: hypothetical protein VGN12_30575 [Pirellulales bacterium]|jgi:hypothetical protein
MVNIQLNDATAAALAAKAASQGLSLEAYLDQMANSGSNPPAPRMSADEFLRLLEQEATDGPSPSGTFPRSEIYSDHD